MTLLLKIKNGTPPMRKVSCPALFMFGNLYYSGTSNKGLSEIGTTSLQGTKSLVP